jgi:hypothetical protein
LFLSAENAIPDTPAAPDPARAGERAAALKEIGERAMDMARMIHAQAQEAFAAGQPVDDLRFSRVSRAVRQIFALEAHLEDELHVRLQRIEAQRKEQQTAEEDRLIARKGAAVRERVEDSIRAETSGSLSVHLEHELCDWLYRRQYDEDFIDRPIDEMIAAIKRDIGLTELEAETAAIRTAEAKSELERGPTSRPSNSSSAHRRERGDPSRPLNRIDTS